MPSETVAANSNSGEYVLGVGEELVYNGVLTGSGTLTPKVSLTSGGTFTAIDDGAGSAVAFTATTNWRTLKGSKRQPIYVRFDNVGTGSWALEIA